MQQNAFIYDTLIFLSPPSPPTSKSVPHIYFISLKTIISLFFDLNNSLVPGYISSVPASIPIVIHKRPYGQFHLFSSWCSTFSVVLSHPKHVLSRDSQTIILIIIELQLVIFFLLLLTKLQSFWVICKERRY